MRFIFSSLKIIFMLSNIFGRNGQLNCVTKILMETEKPMGKNLVTLTAFGSREAVPKS